MRRKKPPVAENHERWLVSYADFITLLFAFFVVMFASSQTDKGKAQQMSEAVKRAIEQNQIGSALQGILGGTPDDTGKGSAQMKGPGGQQKLTEDKQKQGVSADLHPAEKQLEFQLGGELKEGRMSLNLEERGLVVSFQQSTFFPSGTDEIPPETYESVEKVARVIAGMSNPIRCEGHTDSQPLRANARFQSNWELSAARAIAMMEIMAQCCNVSRSRFSIAGYAENAPVAGNEGDADRRRNRRVDIVILSQTGIRAEPEAMIKRLQQQKN